MRDGPVFEIKMRVLQGTGPLLHRCVERKSFITLIDLHGQAEHDVAIRCILTPLRQHDSRGKRGEMHATIFESFS